MVRTSATHHLENKTEIGKGRLRKKKRNFELQPTFWCNVERRFATALQAVECALVHEPEKFER